MLAKALISLSTAQWVFFMQECSECKTKFDPKTSTYKYFCSEKCKLAYWHESPDTPNKKTPKSIQEIRARLDNLALEKRREVERNAPPAPVTETEEDILTFADRIFDEQGVVI